MLPEQVVLASGNPGKLKEISELLAHLAIEVLPQSQFSVPAVEETGLTFTDNAILKARHAAHYTGLPAIADDSGIEVDILGGAPGVRSARYAGIDATDAANLELLIKRVMEKHVENPAARFQCVMVYLRHADERDPVIAQGTWHGYIVTQPQGENGFGYDPVFYVPTHRCTSAELPPEVKNSISHRGQALRELLSKLANFKND